MLYAIAMGEIKRGGFIMLMHVYRGLVILTVILLLHPHVFQLYVPFEIMQHRITDIYCLNMYWDLCLMFNG